MPRRPPVLEEEHIEEILLRLSPHEPAGLFRAALVCKGWCRLICSAAFRRRYREFHRRPPMLAFISNGVADDPDGSRHVSHFVGGITRPRWPAPHASRAIRVLDARHGRILLQPVEEEKPRSDGSRNPFQHAAPEDAHHDRIISRRVGSPVDGARGLVVRIPMTKERLEVPIPSEGLRTLAAAVLCSDTTGACDHLDCHGGHFLVVLVASYYVNDAHIYTYSSETATWNDPISTQRLIGIKRLMPSAYVGNNALYFGFHGEKSILKYDLQLGQISWIQLPSMCNYYYPNVFTTTEEAGVLGLATIRGTKLHVWSMNNDAPQVDGAQWTQTRIIEFGKGLTVADVLCGMRTHVVGFEDGTGVIFFWANSVIHTINLKTCKRTKFYKDRTIYALFPCTSFYTPALDY